MSLEDQINQDMKAAMLAREKDKLEALRAVKAAILLAKTEKNVTSHEINEDVEMKLLQKLVKQRRESADIYQSKGRNDLAEVELFQAGIIEKYLPAQMSEAELTGILKQIIAETGAREIREMGKVMTVASKQLAGKADNKMIADKIRQLLA